MLMKQINEIKFNFYVPMYGTGYFVCRRDILQNATIISFLGIPEGTCDFIEHEVSLAIDIFETIYDYCYNEVFVDINSDNKSWGCSIDFISNEEIVEEFGEGKLDYDTFIEVLYSIVNTHAEDLSQYLW